MSPRRLALSALAVLGGACAVGPNYKRPQVPVPPEFYGAPPGPGDARSLADLPWWQVFDDPVLKGLIDEALRNGFDARLAAARVEEARALYGVARGDLFPAVGYQGGFEKSRADQFSNPDGASVTKWTAKVGFQWEIDLFGRIRRQTEAARARYLATEEARRGVQLSLVTDVATAYFELRELDTELVIARRTTVAFQDTFNLFNRRLEGGAASALETARAEASLGTVAAQIPEIERAIHAKENQINFLLGRNPQPIPRGGPEVPVPPDVPAGLPSALLERRPDVREAEQVLAAACAGIGVAKAAFFPTLSLTGFFGNVSPELSQLFSQGKTWSFQ
ncbi:MAG TPA: efflux transporter outer membrane subunit, partial [Vicinamibacteria bacterium]|nr:efflux transporter outer membrane subunit [Vicinamibacteria bacterium]